MNVFLQFWLAINLGKYNCMCLLINCGFKIIVFSILLNLYLQVQQSMQASAGSTAKDVEVELPQMVHKTSIKLDTIETFVPIIKYHFIFTQSNICPCSTINGT